jgi:hypothetical protein
VTDFITALGAIGTLISALFILQTLKSNHDWQRRQYALDILRDWNKNTNESGHAVEKAFPGIRDIDKTTGRVNEISKDRAKRIYISNPESDGEDFALRCHIIQLLNYLEYVVTAYNSNVADEEVVLSGLKTPIIRWVTILANFLDIVEMCEGFQPWAPLRQTVKEWEHNPVSRRTPTA